MIVKTHLPANSNFGYIALGNGKVTIVDEDVWQWASRYKWYAKKSNNNWYAVRKIYRHGKSYTIRLHRQVCKNCNGKLVHHINRNSLDNRRQNLKPETVDEHRIEHGGW